MRTVAMFVLLAVGCLAIARPAGAIDYAIDPVHTRIAFRVSHAGFSRALGTFEGGTGTLAYDEGDPTTARIEVSLPVASLDLGDDEWNRKVLDGTFFDAKAWPQARFASNSVAVTDKPGVLRVQGDLTIHGVTRPVEFDATVNAVRRHPLTFRRTAGFSAVVRVSRKEFGMGAWSSVVGDEVEILVELEAVRARASDEAGSEAQPLPDPPLLPRGRESDTQRSDDDADADPGNGATSDEPENDPSAEEDDGAAA